MSHNAGIPPDMQEDAPSQKKKLVSNGTIAWERYSRGLHVRRVRWCKRIKGSSDGTNTLFQI
jgi:hypothetical protein